MAAEAAGGESDKAVLEKVSDRTGTGKVRVQASGRQWNG